VSIPRRIIQTNKTSDLEPLAKAVSCNLKLLHPDWEYFFFTDDDIGRFVDDEFPQYRSTFDAFTEPIQRVDFFRYLAVFRLGGFYFDLDVLLSRPLTDLLGCESVFPFEELTLNRYLRRCYNMDWELGNYAFGAAPGNGFLGAVIENCARAQKDPVWLRPMLNGVHSLRRGDFYVFNTTGPALLSRTFAERPDLITQMKVLFPTDVLDRNNWHRFGDYGIHLMTSSWRRGGDSLWRKIANRLDRLSLARVLPESIRLGPIRTIPIARSNSEESGLAPIR
jgi:hypothetical protein